MRLTETPHNQTTFKINLMDHEGMLGLYAVIQQELQSPDANIAKVSIALGSVESPLTKKDPTGRCWPADFLVSRDTASNFHHYAKLVRAVLCESVA